MSDSSFEEVESGIRVHQNRPCLEEGLRFVSCVNTCFKVVYPVGQRQ